MFNLTETLPMKQMNLPAMTIGELTENIFITNWIRREASYSGYFATCQTTLCSYSVNKRRKFLLVLKIMTAIIDGLSSALEIAVLFVVKIVRKFFLWRKENSIQPSP